MHGDTGIYTRMGYGDTALGIRGYILEIQQIGYLGYRGYGDTGDTADSYRDI